MKILDPQSAVLTNSEVISFMSANPLRSPDPKVGGYPAIDLRGLRNVRKEFTDYVSDITPHIRFYPNPPAKYMQNLLQRLDKFNLTKPEVLMIINLGVGAKRTLDSRPRPDGAHEGQEPEVVENVDGDLLDKVERHINSTEKDARLQTSSEHVQTHPDDVQMQDTAEDHPNMSLLNTIVEEMYERLTDAEVNEILHICEEVLAPHMAEDGATPLHASNA